MGEFEQNVMSKLSRLEEREKSNTHRINSIESKIESIPKLTTLMEIVIDTNEKQSETLSKINENLTGLNTEMKSLSGKVNTLGSRVETLEKDHKDRKIDPVLILKTIIVTGIIGFASWFFGFK